MQSSGNLWGVDEGLRQRKKALTRRALRAAAVELAVLRGPERVTVEDIAAAADVSPRTFFNYFSSKDEAMVFPDTEVAQGVAAALLARPEEEPPLEALRAVFGAFLTEMVDQPIEVLDRMQLVREHPALLPGHLAAFAAFETTVIHAMASRTGTDGERDLYPTLLAAAAVAAARTSMMHWKPGQGSAALRALLDEAFQSLAAGLPEPARTRGVRRGSVRGGATG